MKNSCLVDANVFISASEKENSQRKTAMSLLHKLRSSSKKQFVNSLIAAEVATVILLNSKNVEFTDKIMQDLFLGKGALVEMKSLSIKLWQSTYQIFKNQQSHNLSFADCSLIAQARLEEINTIATLDKDLVKEFGDEFEFITG
jgi:predicted nucleic acid-binding protein